MVYTGQSLFIIRRANVYLVVCVLTRITLHCIGGGNSMNDNQIFIVQENILCDML